MYSGVYTAGVGDCLLSFQVEYCYRVGVICLVISLFFFFLAFISNYVVGQDRLLQLDKQFSSYDTVTEPTEREKESKEANEAYMHRMVELNNAKN